MKLHSCCLGENFPETTLDIQNVISHKENSQGNHDNEPLNITSWLDTERDGRDRGKEKEADRNTDSGSSMAANVISV